MTRTVLITGTSSGIGMATALEFRRRGWNVVATMRTPERAPAELAAAADADPARMLVAPLDVTDRASITAAWQAGVHHFGNIDAVVNNAGYAVVGPLEAVTDEQLRRQVDTNLVGLVDVCRVAIPHLRERGGGTIVNVASMGGRITFPLYSLYHATKWAVEGFSESLQHELRPHGIRVRIIEPGLVATPFYGSSMHDAEGPGAEAYADYVACAMPRMQGSGAHGRPPTEAARVIVRAASSRGHRLRWPTQPSLRAVMVLRRALPDWAFNGIVGRAVAR